MANVVIFACSFSQRRKGRRKGAISAVESVKHTVNGLFAALLLRALCEKKRPVWLLPDGSVGKKFM